jgi:hypothetical protein
MRPDNNNAPHESAMRDLATGKGVGRKTVAPHPLHHPSDKRPPLTFSQDRINQAVVDHRDPPWPIFYGTLGGGMSHGVDRDPLRTMRSSNPHVR